MLRHDDDVEYPEDHFLRGIGNGLFIMAMLSIVYLLTRHLL